MPSTTDVAARGIDLYVAELERDLYGRLATRRRLTREIRSHLEEAVENLIERGLTPAEAHRKALEDFGSPREVAAGWAESKGIGVVTSFTRFGGLAGAIGAVGLSLAMAYSDISWSFSIGWFAEIALSFAIFLGIGMVATYVRLRGKLGRYARVGFRLIAAGLVVGFGSSMLWFAPGGAVAIALLLAGAGLYLTGAVRARVLPRQPLLMWVAALVGAAVVGLGGTVVGRDLGRPAMAIGYGLFSLGWVKLGLHLWSEGEPRSASSTEAHPAM